MRGAAAWETRAIAPRRRAAAAAPAALDTPPAETAGLLLAWYDRAARALPWRVGPAARARGERPDPYHVWLSEIDRSRFEPRRRIGWAGLASRSADARRRFVRRTDRTEGQKNC